VRTTAALIAYLAAVLGGGAALSPWVWTAVHTYVPNSWAAHQPFHRVVDRCLLALAIIGLKPLTCFLGVQRSDFTLCWTKTIQKSVVRQFSGGYLMLAALSAGALAMGNRVWAPLAPSALAATCAKALGTALVVAVLEEFLFRGALFGAIRRRQGAIFAAAATSLLYSVGHFFKPAPDPISVDFWSGFYALGQMLAGFVDPANVLGFLALAAAGAALAGLRERSGSIWPGAGLHAGWVFGIKLFNACLPRVGEPSALWGSDRIFDGWAAALGLVAVAVAAWRPEPKPAAPEVNGSLP
jgi:uncharacterized protein